MSSRIDVQIKLIFDIIKVCKNNKKKRIEFFSTKLIQNDRSLI